MQNKTMAIYKENLLKCRSQTTYLASAQPNLASKEESNSVDHITLKFKTWTDRLSDILVRLILQSAKKSP